MAPSYRQLREMSDEDLIAQHDASAPHVQLGPVQYLDELARRDISRQTATLRRLTWVIAFFALVSTAAVLVQVWA